MRQFADRFENIRSETGMSACTQEEVENAITGDRAIAGVKIKLGKVSQTQC